MIKTKRIYDKPSAEDGIRVLVDRLWPRGIKKETAKLDEWAKEISPSNELRKKYGHEPAGWESFKREYRKELSGKEEFLDRLRKEAKARTLTLLYAAKNTEFNNAIALKEILEEKAR